MKLERLPDRPAWPLAPPVLLLAACGGGSDSGDTAAAATGDPLTTYFSYRRINTATTPPFSDLPEFSSIQRGDKDFSRQFDVVANIFDGSHGGIALDYFGTTYAADIDADFQDNKTGVSINWSQRLRSDASETATFNLGYDRRIRASSPASPSLERRHRSRRGLSWSATAAPRTSRPSAPQRPSRRSSRLRRPRLPGISPTTTRPTGSPLRRNDAVFDDFAAVRPVVADRVIVPTTDGVTQATTSLRGIALVPGSMGDRLVFTDAGRRRRRDGLVGAIDGASGRRADRSDDPSGEPPDPARPGGRRRHRRRAPAGRRRGDQQAPDPRRHRPRGSAPGGPVVSSNKASTGPPRSPWSPSTPFARPERWGTSRIPWRPSRARGDDGPRRLQRHAAPPRRAPRAVRAPSTSACPSAASRSIPSETPSSARPRAAPAASA